MSPKPVIIATLLLVVFKLTKYCDWSWWVVFTPLIMFVIITVTALIIDMCIPAEKKQRRKKSDAAARAFGRYYQRIEFLKQQKAQNKTPEKPFQ